MKLTKKSFDAIFEQGKKAALAGFPGAPTPYDDAQRGLAWMAGYDSTSPKDCKKSFEENQLTKKGK
jgi:hypothetical protein